MDACSLHLATCQRHLQGLPEDVAEKFRLQVVDVSQALEHDLRAVNASCINCANEVVHSGERPLVASAALSLEFSGNQSWRISVPPGVSPTIAFRTADNAQGMISLSTENAIHTNVRGIQLRKEMRGVYIVDRGSFTGDLAANVNGKWVSLETLEPIKRLPSNGKAKESSTQRLSPVDLAAKQIAKNLKKLPFYKGVRVAVVGDRVQMSGSREQAAAIVEHAIRRGIPHSVSSLNGVSVTIVLDPLHALPPSSKTAGPRPLTKEENLNTRALEPSSPKETARAQVSSGQRRRGKIIPEKPSSESTFRRESQFLISASSCRQSQTMPHCSA